MELRQYAIFVLRWFWLIALGAVLAGASAYIVSKNTTPIYSAESLLLISPSKAQVMDFSQPINDRLASTYAEMLKREPVLQEVIENLALPTTAENLRRNINVQYLRNTQLIRVVVEDTNAERAAAIANEIPRIFVRQNAALQAQRFAELKTGLLRQIEDTQTQIANLQVRIAAAGAMTVADQKELDHAMCNFT